MIKWIKDFFCSHRRTTLIDGEVNCLDCKRIQMCLVGQQSRRVVVVWVKDDSPARAEIEAKSAEVRITDA